MQEQMQEQAERGQKQAEKEKLANQVAHMMGSRGAA